MASLTEDEIRAIVRSLDTVSSVQSSEAWMRLRELGPAVVPYIAEAYGNMRKWQGRVACVFHLIKYARSHDEAFHVGIEALEDRATLVRYRACMLLAHSQREDALPYLRKLLSHSDNKTVADASAAIDAIESSNPNYFIDRTHSGSMFWSVAGFPKPLEALAEEPKKAWWKFW
jgi:HEAT repeat protein